jgi:hypothetical protein
LYVILYRTGFGGVREKQKERENNSFGKSGKVSVDFQRREEIMKY